MARGQCLHGLQKCRAMSCTSLHMLIRALVHMQQHHHWIYHYSQIASRQLAHPEGASAMNACCSCPMTSLTYAVMSVKHEKISFDLKMTIRGPHSKGAWFTVARLPLSDMKRAATCYSYSWAEQCYISALRACMYGRVAPGDVTRQAWGCSRPTNHERDYRWLNKLWFRARLDSHAHCEGRVPIM